MRAATEPWVTRADLVFGAIVVAVLAVLGVAAGFLWSGISDHSRGYVVSSTYVIPDETEGFVSADGRYLVITAVIGLVAGAVVWSRRSYRGPIAAVALGVGGTLGALITAGLGHVVSSGKDSGPVNTLITLPLTLHAHGLIAVEGALALLLYLGATLFVSPDDLGRPPDPSSPLTSAAGPEPVVTSVGAGGDAQRVGRDGHGPGVGEDGQFTP